MYKECPQHGKQQVFLSPNANWYTAMMAYPPFLNAPTTSKPAKQGCPFDCGPCSQHQQLALLPIVPITSSCNLDCPICYTHNRNEDAYQMTEAQLYAIIGHLRLVDPALRMINLTGGEPTQHPQFDRLLEICQQEGVKQITISTHGLRFIYDEALLQRIANLGARIVLSFDSFKSEVNQAMLGGKFLQGKMQVLALLEKYAVDTTLLPVLAQGQNLDELGEFVQLALTKDFIRSLELHTMTFTGQSGSSFPRSARLTSYEVLAALEQQSFLRISDFVPSPSAHPMCYFICYLLRLNDGSWMPFRRFMQPQDLRKMMRGSLYLNANREVEQILQDVLNDVWSGEFPCDQAELVLASLKNLLARMFAPGLSEARRNAIGERSCKAIYLHAHMDEENFDTERIRQCCVGIREADGNNIPSCAYNVVYRERDTRFNVLPAGPVANLGSGRL